MRLAITCAAWIGVAVSTGSVPLLAQLQSGEKQMTCESRTYGDDRARHCDIREQTLAAIGRLGVDGGRNGGVTIRGSARGDVLVRARVEASGETESAAALMASRVFIDGSGGQVRATGPDPADHSSWSVSYEILVPQNTDLDLKTYNGGMTISNVRGQIHFEGHNGGVHLKNVSGDVTGATMNGGVDVELAGATWEGRQLDVSTHNGGVTLTVPQTYSAHIQAETGMGGIRSDFPMPNPQDGNARSRRMDFNIGSGGAPIHITTGNGSVRLKRAE